jgi:hypothetical protein
MLYIRDRWNSILRTPIVGSGIVLETKVRVKRQRLEVPLKDYLPYGFKAQQLLLLEMLVFL